MAEYYTSSLASGGGDGSIGSPWTLNEAASTMNGGNILWVKDDGPYSVTSSVVFKSGSVFSLTHVKGYSSTPGDGGRPTIRAGADSIFLLGAHPNQYLAFENLIVDANGYTGVTGVSTSANSRVMFVKAVGCSISVNSSTVLFCEVSGGNIIGSGTVAFNCYTVGGPTSGYGVSSAINCISAFHAVHGYSGYNLNQQQSSRFVNCIAYGNGSTGFNGDATFGAGGAVGCISIGNGSYGFRSNGTQTAPLINCAFLNNLSGPFNAGLYAIDSINLEVDPFIDAVNGNFNFNDLEGGGLLFRDNQLVMPGLPDTLNFPYRYWVKESFGGEGTSLSHPLYSEVLR